jgi:hypothetical protein
LRVGAPPPYQTSLDVRGGGGTLTSPIAQTLKLKFQIVIHLELHKNWLKMFLNNFTKTSY